MCGIWYGIWCVVGGISHVCMCEISGVCMCVCVYCDVCVWYLIYVCSIYDVGYVSEKERERDGMAVYDVLCV